MMVSNSLLKIHIISIIPNHYALAALIAQMYHLNIKILVIQLVQIQTD